MAAGYCEASLQCKQFKPLSGGKNRACPLSSFLGVLGGSTNSWWFAAALIVCAGAEAIDVRKGLIKEIVLTSDCSDRFPRKITEAFHMQQNLQILLYRVNASSGANQIIAFNFRYKSLHRIYVWWFVTLSSKFEALYSNKVLQNWIFWFVKQAVIGCLNCVPLVRRPNRFFTKSLERNRKIWSAAHLSNSALIMMTSCAGPSKYWVISNNMWKFSDEAYLALVTCSVVLIQLCIYPLWVPLRAVDVTYISLDWTG